MQPLSKEQHASLYRRLENQFADGRAHRDKLIHLITSTVIRDRLISPKGMTFVSQEAHKGYVGLQYSDEPDIITIHKHALRQLCQKVGLPATYVATLRTLYSALGNEWPADLLAYNLNELFHRIDFSTAKDPQPRFLHRIVGTNMRGFLSRKYNRHMASAPLLESYLQSCDEVGAIPVEAVSTDVKYSLKCVMPEVFMPVENYPVALGVDWSNSDFGAGRLQVSLVVWLPHTNRSWILDNAVSRVHIGSVLEDSDLEISDETARKEVAAQRSAVRDAVTSYLSAQSGQRVLNAISEASQEGIAWSALRPHLNRYLTRKEVDSVKSMLDDRPEDLPPLVNNHASALWAMTALGKIAERQDDPDRKLDLQRAAGSFLKVKLD